MIGTPQYNMEWLAIAHSKTEFKITKIVLLHIIHLPVCINHALAGV